MNLRPQLIDHSVALTSKPSPRGPSVTLCGPSHHGGGERAYFSRDDRLLRKYNQFFCFVFVFVFVIRFCIRMIFGQGLRLALLNLSADSCSCWIYIPPAIIRLIGMNKK